MAITENEKLFLDLNVFEINDEAYVQTLIDEGYIDQERENTEKAEAFIYDFVAARKDRIVEAISNQGNYYKDKGNILFQARLKSSMALELVLERIAGDKVLKRKRDGDFIVRV